MQNNINFIQYFFGVRQAVSLFPSFAFNSIPFKEEI